MNPTRTLATRTETGLLVVILAVVAVSAGWASFTHVHDWTMKHVPAGTPDAFGWVNAVISELVPVAAFLTIRRRLRDRRSIGYPLFLLIASAAFSLSAQLAVAKPGISGWLLSAVPALAFMALVKLVFSSIPTTAALDKAKAVSEFEPTPVPVPEPVPVDQDDTDPTPATVPEPEPEPEQVWPAPVWQPTPMVEPRPPVVAPAVQVPARPVPTGLVSSTVQHPATVPARINGQIVSGVIR